MVLLIIVLVVASNDSNNTEQSNIISNESLELGAIYGLSENVAQYGEWAKRGTDLAVSDVKAGKFDDVLGQYRRDINVSYEDTAGKVEQALSGYNKLRNQGINKFITFQSPIALAIKEVSENNSTFQIDLAATAPEFSSAEDYTYRTGPTATQFAGDLANYLNNNGVENIDLLVINNEYGIGMGDSFKSQYNGTVEIDEVFNADENDFRSLATKVNLSAADSIVVIGHTNESSALIRQVRDLGNADVIYSDTYTVETPVFHETNPEVADVITISPQIDETPFTATYATQFGEDPNAFTAQAYDATLAYIIAASYCEMLTDECLIEQLKSIEFAGASGTIKFDEFGNVAKPTIIKEVRDGEFVEIN